MLNSRKILLISTLLLAGLYFMPLWHIELEAPQFPEGLSMYIWVNKISGNNPNTINTINILNHYIGMKQITPDAIPELRYFPFVVGGLIAFGLFAFFVNNRVSRLSWITTLLFLAILGMYDFYRWEFDYGHNLDPNAPITVPGMTYQPPLIGSKSLLNFNAISLPHAGGLLLAISIALGVFAVAMDFKKQKHAAVKSLSLAFLITCSSMLSCSAPSPEPIRYGSDICGFCSMQIMDNRFGAEYVTSKGRIKKFDSVECLMEALISEKDQRTKDYHAICVTGYTKPGEFVNAKEAFYLINSQIASPMGAYLSAYGNREEAIESHEKNGGEILSWTALLDTFSENN